MRSFADRRRRVAVLSAALAALAASPFAAAQLRYDRGSVFALGRQPSAVATMDLERNGVPEILAVNTADSRLSLFLGRIDPVTRDWFGIRVDERTGRGGEDHGGYGGGGGGGENGASLPGFSTGATPVDLAVGDFDENGVPDVVVAERDGRSISVRLGAATGTLGSPETLRVDGRPIRVATLDFDRDGLDDVLVTCDDDAFLVFGSRQSVFGHVVRVYVPGGLIVNSAVADVDGDSISDIAVLSNVPVDGPQQHPRTAQLTVFFGTGGRAFRTVEVSEFHPGLAFAREFTAGDADGDGRAEMFAAPQTGTGLFVRPGSGEPAAFVETSDAAGSLALADLDEDGFLDVVSANREWDSCFSVLTSDGRGGLESPQRFQAGYFLARPALADLDGDRRLDLVIPAAGVDAEGPGSFELYFDRSRPFFGAGSVNAGRGAIVDVLFANGSTGGVQRHVVAGLRSPLAIDVASPPANAGAAAPFAVFAWDADPMRGPASAQPFGIGTTSLPTPLNGGSPQPIFAWNATGRPSLGAGAACGPAPCRLLDLPSGLRRPITVYLQGLVGDRGSAGTKPASVTNGVLVEVR